MVVALSWLVSRTTSRFQFGLGRLFRIGSQPFNASEQGFWNVVRPKQLGEKLLGPVTIRLEIQSLFSSGG